MYKRQGYQRHMHLMLHKPAGLLTATTDARQKTVMDLLPEELKRRALGPVGRLDKDCLLYTSRCV